ncbi:MAG: AAA family ATPase, partial [Deltaproteobacteria bacterium]|nr:AAA family ATPase [Deltaproteobacteria bacterium]
MDPSQIPSIFSELDIQFARFLMRLSGKESPELFLAAALASSFRREGHICLNLSSVAGKAMGEGEGTWVCPGIESWLDILKQSSMVGNPGEFRPLILEGSRLYLYRYWNYEKQLADTLRGRAGREDLPLDAPLLQQGLSRLFPAEEDGEVNWQKVGAFGSVLKSLGVISGGPGTGKTFTVAGILALHLEQAKGRALRIALAAPTGKAAARLKESIRGAKEKLNGSPEIIAAIPEEASTLHRLLGGIPGSPYFRYNAENPLPVDLLVVDESSMVDLALLSKLTQAVPKEARLILLGDKDQLASVEAGAVLGDICDTGGIHLFSENFCRSYRE